MESKICPFVNGPCIKNKCLSYQVMTFPYCIGTYIISDAQPYVNVSKKDKTFVSVNIHICADKVVDYYNCKVIDIRLGQSNPRLRAMSSNQTIYVPKNRIEEHGLEKALEIQGYTWVRDKKELEKYEKML